MIRGVQVGIGVLAVAAGLGVGLLVGGGSGEDSASSTLETLGSAKGEHEKVGGFQSRVDVPGLSEPEPTAAASETPEVATPEATPAPAPPASPPPPGDTTTGRTTTVTR